MRLSAADCVYTSVFWGLRQTCALAPKPTMSLHLDPAETSVTQTPCANPASKLWLYTPVAQALVKAVRKNTLIAYCHNYV